MVDPYELISCLVLVSCMTCCHTRFLKRNRMHLICVPGSSFTHIIDSISVISKDNAQNVYKGLFITLIGIDSKVFTRTVITKTMQHRLQHPQASDWGIACLRTRRSHWSTPLQCSPLNSIYARVSTLMVGTQQGWEECKATKVRLRLIAGSIIKLVKVLLASTYLLSVSLYQPI